MNDHIFFCQFSQDFFIDSVVAINILLTELFENTINLILLHIYNNEQYM